MLVPPRLGTLLHTPESFSMTIRSVAALVHLQPSISVTTTTHHKKEIKQLNEKHANDQGRALSQES